MQKLWPRRVFFVSLGKGWKFLDVLERPLRAPTPNFKWAENLCTHEIAFRHFEIWSERSSERKKMKEFQVESKFFLQKCRPKGHPASWWWRDRKCPRFEKTSNIRQTKNGNISNANFQVQNYRNAKKTSTENSTAASISTWELVNKALPPILIFWPHSSTIIKKSEFLLVWAS